MSYIKDIAIGNSTHLIEPILHSTATYDNTNDANTYVASISNFELVEGVTISLTLNTTNLSSNPKLAINPEDPENLQGIEIKSDGNAIEASQCIAGRTYSLVYRNPSNPSNPYWQIIGGVNEDTKVTQTAITTGDYWYKALLTQNTTQAAHSSTNQSTSTSTVNFSQEIAVQPSTGTMRAKQFRIDGNENNNEIFNVILSYNTNENSLDFSFASEVY